MQRLLPYNTMFHAVYDCLLRFVCGGLLILAMLALSGIGQLLAGKF